MEAWIDVAKVKVVWGPWRGGEAGRWHEVPMYRPGGSASPYRMDASKFCFYNSIV